MAPENGTGAGVTKIASTVLGGIVTTALVSISAFTFSTSKNVAVLSENYRNLSERMQLLKQQQETESQRVRELEQLVSNLRVDQARYHGSK